MSSELAVLLENDEIGRLARDRRGRLSFRYAAEWRTRVDAFPLSLSLPLLAETHEGTTLSAYLWGLLPDSELILDAWAKRFGVSLGSPYGLLEHIGEDCPGAVRFVDPASPPRARGHVDWLDEHSVAERLRALHRDASLWRAEADTGQFSLGGAQPKTALYSDGKRWGIPTGRLPTTHILKPGSEHLAGHAENEHFCLSLARALGLPTASTTIQTFEDQVAICVERYDRLRVAQTIVRIHQEDFCQALGVLPTHKYEAEGGPGAVAIDAVLREASTKSAVDRETFLQALVVQWLVVGTDAHAKNYSLIRGHGQVRLAPLYDISSFLPYEGYGKRKTKLAMKVGGKYRVHEIGIHAWNKLAKELGRSADEVRDVILGLAAALPDHAASTLAKAKSDGLTHPVLAEITKLAQARARACAQLFA